MLYSFLQQRGVHRVTKIVYLTVVGHTFLNNKIENIFTLVVPCLLTNTPDIENNMANSLFTQNFTSVEDLVPNNSLPLIGLNSYTLSNNSLNTMSMNTNTQSTTFSYCSPAELERSAWLATQRQVTIELDDLSNPATTATRVELPGNYFNSRLFLIYFCSYLKHLLLFIFKIYIKL